MICGKSSWNCINDSGGEIFEILSFLEFVIISPKKRVRQIWIPFTKSLVKVGPVRPEKKMKICEKITDRRTTDEQKSSLELSAQVSWKFYETDAHIHVEFDFKILFNKSIHLSSKLTNEAKSASLTS